MNTYLYNKSIIFKSNNSIGCIDEMHSNIINDLESDIVLYFKIENEYNNTFLSFDSFFNDFINNILNNFKPNEAKVTYRILEEIKDRLIDGENLVDISMYLHKEDGFYIDDIANTIMTNESLLYTIKQEFIKKNMFIDSFDNKISEEDIDDLVW